MPKAKNGFRLIGISIIVGGILMAIATVLHPPLVNPYDGEKAFQGYSHSDVWMWDHILMLIAISLWLLGLAGSESFFSEGNKAFRTGSQLFFVSLSLWIVILAAELTVLPLLGKEILRDDNVTLTEVWEAVFSFGFLSGYFAVACGWLGVAFYGWGLMHCKSDFTNWFKKGAFYTGLAGFIGIIFISFSFETGYIILPLTSGPAFLWTLWLGWKIFKTE